MNPNRIDLNLLKVFDAILQTRSVTVAASNLGLTQSTVSNALNRLRDALDDPLFVRTPEGMMPTPRAEQIAAPIRESISRIRQTLEQSLGFEPQSAERTFRLFMSGVGQMILLPKLLRLVGEEAPLVSIRVEPVPPFRMRETAMEAGDVDLAVGYLPEFEGPFRCQSLFREDFVCVVRSGHPQIQGGLTLEQFLQVRHLVHMPAGSGHASTEALVDEVFQKHGLRRPVAVRVGHTMGLWTLVAENDLLAVLPRGLAAAFADMAPLQILEPPIVLPSFDVGQFWHERYHHDPANKWLRSRIAALYAR